MLSAWLIVAAAALFGAAMIQSPAWVIAGYLLTAYAVVGGLAMLVAAPTFFVAIGFYIVALAPAFALWWGRAV